MKQIASIPILWCAVVALLVSGCVGGGSDPAQAQMSYGASVDATDAIPALAVAAEDDFYADRSLTVDGRIIAVRAGGCTLHLATDATPLVISAARTDAGDCAWQVPSDAQGFAVAAGTLRVEDDTLRLAANGVQVTPVRHSNTAAQQ